MNLLKNTLLAAALFVGFASAEEAKKEEAKATVEPKVEYVVFKQAHEKAQEATEVLLKAKTEIGKAVTALEAEIKALEDKKDATAEDKKTLEAKKVELESKKAALKVQDDAVKSAQEAEAKASEARYANRPFGDRLKETAVVVVTATGIYALNDQIVAHPYYTAAAFLTVGLVAGYAIGVSETDNDDFDDFN